MNVHNVQRSLFSSLAHDGQYDEPHGLRAEPARGARSC